MSWSRRLWRTLPIALVIVLAAATAVFAGSKPTGVTITGAPTATYPNYFNSDANVTVNFVYTSQPDNPNSTTADVYLLEHGTETVVATAHKDPLSEGVDQTGAINVTTPVDATDGTRYDVRIVVSNSNGSCDPVTVSEAVEIDKVGPSAVGLPITVTGGVPTKVNTPEFNWTGATDDRAGIRSYWVAVDHSATAPAVAAMADKGDVTHWMSASLADANDWYFHIRAQDKAFNYGPAETFGPFTLDTTPPSLPANLVGATGSADAVLKWRMNDTTPTVNWDASTDAGVGLDASEPYEFQIGLTTGTDGHVALTAVDALTYTVQAGKEFTEDTDYFVQVRAKDALGNTSDWMELVFVHDQSAPTAPVGIGLTGSVVVGADNWTKNSTPEFTWTDSTDTQAMHATAPHRVKIGTATGLSDLLGVTGAGVSPYTAADLGWTTGNEYFFNVQGQDAAGNVSAFVEYKFKFDGAAPTFTDTPVTGIVGAGGHRYTNDTTPTIDWTPATDVGSGLATGPSEPYEIRIGTTYGLSDVGSGTSVTNSYTPGAPLALTNGTTYYVQVRAKDATGNWSDWADCQGTFIYDDGAPSVPGNLVGATGSLGDAKWRMNDTTPTVNWDASIDTGVGLHASEPYEFQIGLTTGAFDHVPLTAVDALTYTVPGGKEFTEGTDYFVQVRAKDALGNTSGWMELVFVHDQTLPNAPSGIGLTGSLLVGGDIWTSNSTPEFTWTDSTDTQAIHATAPHKVKIGTATDPEKDDLLAVTDTDNSPYTAADLGWTTGSEYFFNAQGQDAAGNVSAFVQYAFKFDNTPPVVTGSPVTGTVGTGGHRYTNDTTPTIDWIPATDGDSGLHATPYSVRIGTSYGDNSVMSEKSSNTNSYTPIAPLTLTDGETYYMQVSARDALSNWSDWANCQGAFIYDNEGPTAPGTPTTEYFNGTTYYTDDLRPQIDWTASTDALSGMPTTGAYEIKIGSAQDGVDILPATLVDSNTYTPAGDLGLTDGSTYYVSVRAFDVVGNPSHAADPWVRGEFVYDSGPPQFANAVPTDGYETNEANPTISIDITDAGSGVDNTSIDWTITHLPSTDIDNTPSWSDPTATCALTTPLTTVAQEGYYSIEVVADDNLGNHGTYPVGTWQFMFDMTPPTLDSSSVSYDAPMTGLYVDADGKVYTNDDTPTVTFSVADALSGFDDDADGTIVVKDKSGNIVPGTPAFTPSGLTAEVTWDPLGSMAKGEYTATLTVDDDAENEAEFTYTFRIDDEVPNSVLGDTIWAGSQNTANSSWYTNSRRPTWHWENPGDPDLETDVPGSQIKNYDLYLVKNKGMGETIVDATLGGTNGAPIVVPTSETDWEVWQPAGDLPLVAGDEIGVYIKARDNAMNATAYADPPLIFDPDPPTMPGTPSTTSPTVDGTPTWSWDGSTDAISGVDGYHIQIRRFGSADWDVLDTFLDIPDSSPANPQTWTQGLSLADGQYEIRVRAMDVAGNYSDWCDPGTVTVDATPPAAPAIQALDAGYNTSPIAIDWNAVTDGANAITYVLQYADNEGFSAPIHEATGLSAPEYSFVVASEGEYWFRVKTISTLPGTGGVKESGWSPIVSTIYDHTGPAAPELMLLTPNPTNQSPQTWSWSAPAGATRYEVQADNGAWVNVNDTRTYQTEFDTTGIHYFRVKAYDWLDNEGSVVEGTVEVDVTAPAVPTGLEVVSPTTDKTPTWSWTAVAGATGYEVRLDLTIVRDVATATSYTHAEELSNGNHTLEVRSYDTLGNTLGWCAPVTVTVDTLPPAAPAIEALDPGYTTNKITLEWNQVTDLPNTITYELQWATNAGFSGATTVAVTPDNPASPSYEFTFPSEREYWFRVKTISTLPGTGGVKESGWSPIVSTIYDHTGPAAPVLMLLTPNPTNQSPQTWSWSAPDGAVGYRVWHELTDTWEDVFDTRTYQTTFSTTGTHTFKVKAYDWLDTEGSVVEGTVEVDMDAPAIPTGLQLTEPAGTTIGTELYTADETPKVKWNVVVNGDLDHYVVEIDGQAWINVDKTTAYYEFTEGLADGEHTVKVKAVDELGNESLYSAALVFTVDTTPPGRPNMPMTARLTKEADQVWTWDVVTDAGSGFDHYEVLINNTLPVAASVTIATHTTSLTDGDHFLQVRSVDKLGNTSLWSDPGYVTVDLTPPGRPVMKTLAQFTRDLTVRFEWTKTSADTEYYEISYTVDGGEEWSAPLRVDGEFYVVDIADVPDGVAVIGIVRAYDAVGNASGWSDELLGAPSASTIVDRTGPVVTITKPTEAVTTNAAKFKYEWTAVDAGCGVDYCTVVFNGGEHQVTATTGEGAYAWTGTLIEGENTFEVWATDKLGNKSKVVAVAPVVTQVMPQIGMIHPLDGATYKINEISTIAFQVVGLIDGPVEVSLNLGGPLEPWRIVTVVNSTTMAKFYVLLDGDVLVPGRLDVRISVGAANKLCSYTVDSERSGFGFGRLRPW